MKREAKKPKETPSYVANLEQVYGPPSQAGFGGAVFFTDVDPDTKLEKLALKYYKHFVGELWERWGEDAWMGPWKEVYARKADAKADVLVELQGITDSAAQISMMLITDPAAGADTETNVLVDAFDDPAVTDFRVYNVGDGGAMSGLMIAGRRDDGTATFVIALMD